MGQNQANQIIRRSNLGKRFKGQTVFALAIALACTGALAQTAGTQTPADALNFQQARAWEDLKKQVAFGYRIPGTADHIKCRDYINDELKKSCDEVKLQPLTHTWSKTGKEVKMFNIIGTQNWEHAKQRIVLLAHWDSRPSADQEETEERRAKPIPGANDGASGVSVLLELARVMKGKVPKDLGVMYLMTDGEDLGPGLNEMFLGAVYFSKHLPEQKPNYGILLDMVGDKDLKIPLEPNSMQYAGNLMFDFFRNAAEAGSGSAFPQVMGPEILDDHLSLNEAKIPTIDLIDFDYPQWHTLDDTVAHCSADSLGKVGRALQRWLLMDPPYELKK